MKHPTAIIDPGAKVPESASVWHWTHVREGAVLGEEVSIGQCCYVDRNVRIGPRSRIQNSVSIYEGVSVGSDVFIGPSVAFTNDLFPRVGLPWEVTPTIVEDGASIGANATILCGITIGRGAMIGCGAVVTKDVPAGTVVFGERAVVKR